MDNKEPDKAKHPASASLVNYMSQHLSQSDVYAAEAVAMVTATLINCRKARNMTQRQFAKVLGINQTMMIKWESGEYNFSIADIALIAAKLDMVLNMELVVNPRLERK